MIEEKLVCQALSARRESREKERSKCLPNKIFFIHSQNQTESKHSFQTGVKLSRPAALLAESLLGPKHDDFGRLGVRLTHLVTTVVVLSIRERHVASLHLTSRHGRGSRRGRGGSLIVARTSPSLSSERLPTILKVVPLPKVQARQMHVLPSPSPSPSHHLLPILSPTIQHSQIPTLVAAAAAVHKRSRKKTIPI